MRAGVSRVGCMPLLGVRLIIGSHIFGFFLCLSVDTHGIIRRFQRENIQPGDLITYNASNGVGHVVIYMGDGKCIEAAGGAGVTIRDVKWDRMKSIRRVPLD